MGRKGFIDKRFKREVPLYLMVFPGSLVVLIYAYGPMFGIVMAFQRFLPSKGFFKSSWIGFKNFEYILNMPGIFRVLWNTLFIAVMKIIFGLLVPIVFALLLNEVKSKKFKRIIQTMVYLPYFLSWVILGGMLIDILSPSYGIVNQFLTGLGMEPVFFLGDNRIFPYAMVVTDVWKNFGFNTIIYLAALAGINPELYESSLMDGANRWRQTWNITFPGMLPIIILVAVLSLGNVLNAGFDQIFNLYSPQVYKSGDIIDTMVYRVGFVNAQYSVSAALGLFKSLVSFILIVFSYKLADKVAGYKIF